MYHYGGMTPKKHYAYANSSAIASLWVQRLTGWTKIPKEERERRKTTTVYKDGTGKTRFKGNANLRKSEWYPQLLFSFANGFKHQTLVLSNLEFQTYLSQDFDHPGETVIHHLEHVLV